ncbi:cytochrome c-type protein NrfB [Gammaproteobacteria bacterium]|nr:cytochrome c-type protein NrfB [Gammaproteobacteria bacterium]
MRNISYFFKKNLALIAGISLIGLISLNSAAFAQDAPKIAPRLDAQGKHIVDFTNPKDRACTKCHNDGKIENQVDDIDDDIVYKFGKLNHKGFHLNQINPATLEPITCTNCHGNAATLHRDGIKDVMKFQSAVQASLDPFGRLQPYRADEQNAVCYTCHKPADLQASFWPHDVHATKVACSSCHSIHVDDQKQEAMHILEPKSYQKLCVSCHEKQFEIKSLMKKGSLQ